MELNTLNGFTKKPGSKPFDPKEPKGKAIKKKRKGKSIEVSQKKLISGVNKIVDGGDFAKLTIKDRTVLGIGLMNHQYETMDYLKKFPMHDRESVRKVLVGLGKGKEIQYQPTGVAVDDRVKRIFAGEDDEGIDRFTKDGLERNGYFADNLLRELIKQNALGLKALLDKCAEEMMKHVDD
eukprot:526684_1